MKTNAKKPAEFPKRLKEGNAEVTIYKQSNPSRRLNTDTGKWEATGKVFDEALKIAREVVAAAPTVVRRLKCFLRIKREDFLLELEANAAQQAKDFQTEEYRSRIANYLPKHYG